MRIKSAEFVISVADSAKLPHFGAPEIAFAGKSNSGKSSFINFLTGNGKLARTSSEPGRTRLINYFSVNGGELMFVDLPGYGFARAPKSEQAKWGRLAEGYLEGSENFYAKNIPFTVIATKCDKLSRAQQATRRRAIAEAFGIGLMNVYLVSSLKKTGAGEIMSRIDDILSV